MTDLRRPVAGAAMTCGMLAALIGLTPLGGDLYLRDTPFVAGAAQGGDLLSLGLVVGGAWALVRHGAVADVVLACVAAWLLYLFAGYAFGAVVFNAAFPLYVAAMPLSFWAVLLTARRLARLAAPAGLSAFLAASGVITGAVWTLLLWQEMSTGLAVTPYSVRTTYALDLGVIAPLCVAAALAVARGASWCMCLAGPLLGLEALLLPKMSAQTAMQLRAGVVFGPDAAAPFLGFGILSGLAFLFLRRSLRAPNRETSI